MQSEEKEQRLLSESVRQAQKGRKKHQLTLLVCTKCKADVAFKHDYTLATHIWSKKFTPERIFIGIWPKGMFGGS